MLNGTLNANLLIAVLLLPFKFYKIKNKKKLSKLFHWKATPTQAFNEFLCEFLRIFLISENSLKFAIFFAEVTNSRSMGLARVCRNSRLHRGVKTIRYSNN